MRCGRMRFPREARHGKGSSKRLVAAHALALQAYPSCDGELANTLKLPNDESNNLTACVPRSFGDIQRFDQPPESH